MKYLAVLGRQPEISIAELEAIYGVGRYQTSFSGRSGALVQVLDSSKDVLMPPSIDRFGGVLKFAIKLEQMPLEFWRSCQRGS